MVRHKKPKSRLHKALGTHPHKHTGKLLPHKHTSYRVLFLLMLVTAGLMVAVNQLNVLATDISVKAKVPAPMPSGTPTIDSPVSGFTVPYTQNQVTVTGTCPVITPAIIVVIYDNGNVAGSVQCDPSGNYTVPASVSYGTNSLVATVVTITDDQGNSSSPVSVIRNFPPPPPSPSPSPTTKPVSKPATPPPTIPEQEILTPSVQIIPAEPFVSIQPQTGKVSWTGSVKGGTTPYQVIADWGDGTVDKKSVANHDPVTFTHVYKTPRVYALLVKAVDFKGVETVLYSTAISPIVKNGNTPDVSNKTPTVNPIVGFVSQNAPYIYVGALSALVFLWYLEHGRAMIAAHKAINNLTTKK